MVKVIAKIGVQASHIDFDEDKECSYYTLIGRKLQEGRSPAESAVLVFAQRSVRSIYIDGNIRPEDFNPVVGATGIETFSLGEMGKELRARLMLLNRSHQRNIR